MAKAKATNDEAAAAVEDMTISEKAAYAEGVELAEKYAEEVAAREEDDPLVLQKRDAEPGEAVDAGTFPAAEPAEEE